MTGITWTDYGSSQTYWETLFNALRYDEPLSDVTASHFTLSRSGDAYVYPAKIVVSGSFTLDSGVPVSGTVTGFKVYSNDVLVLDATGYSIDLSAFTSALDQYAGGDFQSLRALLIDVPKTIHGSAYDETLFGGNAADSIYGGGGSDDLHGYRGADRLFGGAGKDTLLGDNGKDVLKGGGGSDLLDGGDRSDVLTGNAGKDSFYFDYNLGPKNIDRITDFEHGRDSLWLDGGYVFTAFGYTGVLKAGNFVVGAAAKDGNDYLIYNKATGALSYDADGKGGMAPVQFARFDGSPTLTHTDIHLY